MKGIIMAALLFIATTRGADLKKGGSLPTYREPCLRDSIQFDTCIKNALNHLLPLLGTRGISELDLSSLDPLYVAEMIFNYEDLPDISGKVTISDVVTLGLSRVTIHSVRSRLDDSKMSMEVDFSLPEGVKVEGDFTMNGRVGRFPISGSGPFNITTGEVDGVWRMYGRVVEESWRDSNKSDKYLDLLHFGMRPSLSYFRIEAQNVFNGHPRLTKLILAFVNRFWQLLYNQSLPVLEKNLDVLGRKLLNKLFHNVPYDQLFPKRKEAEEKPKKGMKEEKASTPTGESSKKTIKSGPASAVRFNVDGKDSVHYQVSHEQQQQQELKNHENSVDHAKKSLIKLRTKDLFGGHALKSSHLKESASEQLDTYTEDDLLSDFHGKEAIKTLNRGENRFQEQLTFEIPHREAARTRSSVMGGFRHTEFISARGRPNTSLPRLRGTSMNAPNKQGGFMTHGTVPEWINISSESSSRHSSGKDRSKSRRHREKERSQEYWHMGIRSLFYPNLKTNDHVSTLEYIPNNWAQLPDPALHHEAHQHKSKQQPSAHYRNEKLQQAVKHHFKSDSIQNQPDMQKLGSTPMREKHIPIGRERAVVKNHKSIDAQGFASDQNNHRFTSEANDTKITYLNSYYSDLILNGFDQS